MQCFKFAVIGMLFGIFLSGLVHAAELNESFLGVKWGTNISALPNFKKISGKDDVVYYENPTKIYTVFEVENPSVIYGFYKDQFCATYIQIDTFMVFERVKAHISEKFGTPKTILKMKTQQTIYRWKHQDLKIKLKLFEAQSKMKLAFYFTPLSSKLSEAQRESFPTVPKRVTTLDDSTKQQMHREIKLQQALDVMGF